MGSGTRTAAGGGGEYRSRCCGSRPTLVPDLVVEYSRHHHHQQQHQHHHHDYVIVYFSSNQRRPIVFPSFLPHWPDCFR